MARRLTGQQVELELGGRIERIPGKILVFDLETERLFEDVGGQGAGKARQLGMSVGVTLNLSTGAYAVWHKHSVDELLDELFSAELVVGWNHVGFDYEVLSAYSLRSLSELPSLDMMVELKSSVGFRLKLDSVAQSTLGAGKCADGLQAVAWFREGNWKDLEHYCKEDVRVTSEVYLFGLEHGHVLYEDRATGALVKAMASWGAKTCQPQS